jgi:DNA repair exonuclease SbcCD ATPase subunit
MKEEVLDSGAEGKSLRLLQLRLSNFKGIKDFTLDIDGRNASIMGNNATGKTSLFDAFVYLLFGKDSLNRADFEIKTLDENGKAISGLDHEVEGVFELGDRQFTLRKVYSEKWTKQRGSANSVFTGHETAHFVDGVPVAKAKYEARIAEIVDENVFRLLSDPAYFNRELHWQERRKLLLEVCGDISDDQVIASDVKLSDLTEILGNRSLEDHRKVIAARQTVIKKELEKILVRIAEVQRGLPDVSKLDTEKLAEDLGGLKADRQVKMEELARAQTGGEAAEKQKRLREIEGHLLDLENRARSAHDTAVRTKRSEVEDLRFKAGSAERELTGLAGEQVTAEREAERLDERLQRLHEQFNETQSREFTHSDLATCPTCGQSLPEDMVARAREKALEQFNLDMSEKLESINAQGKATKEQRKQVEVEIARCQKQTAAVEKRLADLKRQASAGQVQFEKLQLEGGKVSETVEYAKLANERDALGETIAGLRSGSQAVLDDMRAEVAALGEAVASHEKSLLLLDQRQSGEKRIEELKAQERELASEFERLEAELYLSEEFVRTKVRLLEDRINARFKHATFKLFETQVNGALAETCQTVYKGVPYSDLNSGSQMKIGLDVLNTLSEHYGFSAPIWVDGAEGVTKLIPVRGQLIRLVVSKDDETLRVVDDSKPVSLVAEGIELLRKLKEEV